MRLKKLELHGFKSFANKTVVSFDKGVTCIVGPNGCGKSNISDAMRWVLGERSAKMLRGAKMEDVIFNGTDFRKPLALAEVSLTIDNEDRGLPIDYHEVTLTRRLYRSGESEYLINKTPCRLKDIYDLILDTGIGSSSYSMIEQGRIDYILRASADERRFLIEEAAGISKYKVKKDEALRKLERTEQNRQRLNDIVSEVHKNIQYAERQAKRAARYKDLFENLKKLELKKAFYELTKLQEEKNNLNNYQASSNKELVKQEEAIELCKNKQTAIATTLRGVLDRFSTKDSERHAIQIKLEQNEQQLQFHKERRNEIADRLIKISSDKKALLGQIQSHKIEISAKQNEIQELNADKNQASDEYDQSQQTLRSIEDQILETKSTIRELRSQSLEAAAKTSNIRNEYNKLNVYLESNKERSHSRKEGAARLKEEAGKWQSKHENYKEELNLLQETLNNIQSETQVTQHEYDQCQAKVHVANKEIQQIDRKLHEKQTRLQLLQELDTMEEQDLESTLKENGLDDLDLLRKLRDLVTVRPGYEWALDAALEGMIQAYIVNDIDTAKIALESCLATGKGSVGFFLRSRNTDQNAVSKKMLELPHVEHRLSDLVTIQEGFSDVFDAFLSSCYITDNLSPETFLDTFLDHSQNCRFFTEAGLILGPNRYISYRRGHQSSEENIFRRHSEIQQLQDEIRATQIRLESSQKNISFIEEEIRSLESSLKQLQERHLEATVQRESCQSLREGLEDRLGSYQQELDLLFVETQQLDGQQGEATVKSDKLREELQQCETREKEISVQLEQLMHQQEEYDASRTNALRLFAEAKAKFDNIHERNQLLQVALNVLTSSQQRDEDRIHSLESEALELSEKQEELTKLDTQIREEQVAANRNLQSADEALMSIRKDKENAENSMETLDAELELLQSTYRELQEQLHDREKRSMDLGYQEKSISERLSQTYRIDLAQHAAENYIMAGDETIEGITESIAKHSEKVEKIGSVNILAIDEYEELKTRYDFLTAQQDDLETARNALLETIRKINRTTKSLFETTLQNVQNMFQGYYETLFRGGQAKLVLIDESNPLESGIDIVVRPPGKKLTHISLLSGGEKALTAIALLFALFKIKPSPFSVLDEIDAPLDEANIDRFLSVLQEFLKTSQFIIVTHNRKTIGMGDSLYGVTMEEPGISKIVSVKMTPEEIDELKAKESSKSITQDKVIK